MALVIGLHYSPWTEKACWALDFSQVPYRFEEHILGLGMPALCWKTRTLPEGATVPVFIPDRKAPVFDSYRIAELASELRAEGVPTLFPPELRAEIEEANRESELAIDALRALAIQKTLANPGLWPELLPAGFPDFIRPVAKWAVPWISRSIASSFGADDRRTERAQSELRSFLENLRARLARKGGESDGILGPLTYADFSLAVVLQGVRPVSKEYLRISKANRELWTDESLAREFEDLLRWRDELYLKFRRKRG